jgi:hypothetical protein
MKTEIVEFLLSNINKQNVSSILIIGSNGVSTDVIDNKKDIDFIVITKDIIDSFNYLKSISKISKLAILQFDMSINVYPINESVFNNESTTFLKNIKSNNEVIWRE